MGGRALGALGPAHQARECPQYSRPTLGHYRDPRGPGGTGGQPGVQGPARGPAWYLQRNYRNEDILSRYFCESPTQAWDQCTVC